MRDFQAVTTYKELDALVEELENGPDLIAFDVETGYTSAETVDKRSLNTRHPDFVVVGFSITNNSAWSRYIPLRHDTEQPLEPKIVWEKFRNIFETKTIIAHNASFERAAVASLYRAGDVEKPLEIKNVGHDTMIIANLLGKFKNGVGLKALTKEVLGEDQTEFATLFGDSVKDKNGKIVAAKVKKVRFNSLPVTPEVVDYGCDDTALCMELFNVLYPQLTEQLKRVYMVEMQILVLMAQAEEYGVGVDWAGIQKAYAQYQSFRPKFETKVREEFAAMTVDPELKELARTANFGSAVQMRKLLYNGLGMKTTRTTNSGEMSTDAKALEALSRKHPAVRSLLSLREIDNMGRRLKKWLAEYSDCFDKRVHPSFNQVRVASGRFAASDPSIQQCVDGETEVLTPNGWVRFDALLDGTPVAQYDPSTEEIDFVIPEVIRKNHNGDMLKLTMWGREFMFTPEHRILSKTRGPRGTKEERARNGSWKTDTAADWAEWGSSRGCKDRSFPRAGFKRTGRVLTEEERLSLVLAVCVQADAYRHTAGNYDWYEIDVAKERKRDQLEALGLVVKERDNDLYLSGKVWTTKVKPSDVSMWLNEDKSFKIDALLSLSEEDMRTFMSAVFKWDGDSTREESYCQSVDREAAVSAVQAVASLCGYSTSQNYKNDGNGAWQLNICDRDKRKADYIESEVIPWDDKVYCVQVPTSYFLIRRNRLVQVTGNCPKDWFWHVNDENAEGVNGETYWSGNFRKFIVAGEGRSLITFDYANQEIRVLAGLTQEPAFLRGFKRGDDPHRTAAALVFNKPYNDITKEERQSTKSVQFGILYGMGSKALGEQLAVSKEEAEELIDTYKARLSKVGMWDSVSRSMGVNNKYVTTWFGRVVPLWDAYSDDPYKRSGAERLAVNAQIQGGAADYTKLAMIRAWSMLKAKGMWGFDKVMLTMNQHDSLTFEFPNELDPNEIRDILQEAVVFEARKMFPKMQIPVFPRFDVDWEMGKTWGGSVAWPLDKSAHKTNTGWEIDETTEDHLEVAEWEKQDETASVEVQTVMLAPDVLHVVWTGKQSQNKIAAFNELVKNNPGDSAVYLTMGGKSAKMGVTTNLTKADASQISMTLGGAEVFERTEEEMKELL